MRAGSTSCSSLALAALSGASESVIVKRARLGTEVLGVTAWQFLVGSIPLLLLSALTERNRSIQWTPPFLFALLFLVPVIGLMLGMAFLAERLSAMQGAGIGLALAACGVAAAFATRGQPS